MTRYKLPHIDLEILAAERRAGVMPHELAERHGVTSGTIRNWLRRAGVSIARDVSAEQKETVMDAIIRYKKDSQGNSPSFRWLMANSTCNSTNTVRETLFALEEEGRIKLPSDGRARHIVVAGARWVYEVER